MMRSSFVEISGDSHFSMQNFPFGVFRVGEGVGRVGSRIGDFVVDLPELARCIPSIFSGEMSAEVAVDVFSQSELNAFMSTGRPAWRQMREILIEAFAEDGRYAQLREDSGLREKILIPAGSVTMLLPATIGDYTDFYASKYHAENIGTMLRGKENALMPNWVHLPVGYHGRASSVVVSGTPIRRPMGQTADAENKPSFGPCRLLDFELEVAFFVGGKPNELGEPISVENARENIFGMVLMNDWSARDVQKWEYVPLGPFLSKNFATTISPWVVTMDALEPFVTAAALQDPKVLPYLDDAAFRRTFDIELTASIRTPQSVDPALICTTNFKHLYWTMEQMLAHHSVTGCPMRPGDLLASGTVSGPTEESFASFMELSWRGSKPVVISEGKETRKFIQDGDEIILSGLAKNDGAQVGFGGCAGLVLPARQ